MENPKRVRKTTIINKEKIEYLAKTLAKQIGEELFEKKYASTAAILKMVGAGFFLAASVVAPGLPRIFGKNFREKEYRASKRFNLHYLKRALKNLEEQKLIEIHHQGKMEIVKITNKGRSKILKFSLNELKIKKPTVWDKKWRLVSYDIPKKLEIKRKTFSQYLRMWGFYLLHESLFLHAYPCEKEIEFLREYLEIGKYIRIFTVEKIEDDKLFREYFDV